MSRTIYLTKGTELRFEDDWYTVTDRNAGGLYYLVSDEGEELKMTREEIARELKAVDGMNHEIYWNWEGEEA